MERRGWGWGGGGGRCVRIGLDGCSWVGGPPRCMLAPIAPWRRPVAGRRAGGRRRPIKSRPRPRLSHARIRVLLDRRICCVANPARPVAPPSRLRHGPAGPPARPPAPARRGRISASHFYESSTRKPRFPEPSTRKPRFSESSIRKRLSESSAWKRRSRRSRHGCVTGPSRRRRLRPFASGLCASERQGERQRGREREN